MCVELAYLEGYGSHEGSVAIQTPLLQELSIEGGVGFQGNQPLKYVQSYVTLRLIIHLYTLSSSPVCRCNRYSMRLSVMKYTGTSTRAELPVYCIKQEDFSVFYITTTPYLTCNKSHTLPKGTV